ncbi:ATP-binding protein [Phyllobacterium lublinensis]|uniref:ATP-binding protein n=1 Tax=Phyllobacterium lublinensis TaxID=2875708 RepID=UPI001CC93AF7|nr:ATP-binding protein [Phyllobacterium sp. 2063]MBZ9654013.1 ATP-binding protein [Phyllobacterium sp. 2063]
MIEGLAFQAKARTVDHLGREQIADCPTAISELWKNSYDAYASNVELSVFAGDEPVAVMVDNGHGMNREEFVSRWLVVGTESKISSDNLRASDMKGLRRRPKQGQKGIGRLSSANLGPLLLVVSKRQDNDFVSALIDWRLFENPYLNLADIEIPLAVFSAKGDLLSELPNLFQKLIGNVKPDGNDARSQRVSNAWQEFDDYWRHSSGKQADEEVAPSVRILSTAVGSLFTEKHLQRWAVWSGEASSGTAMLVSGINYDLRILLDDSKTLDRAAYSAKQRFFETLSSFVDPFTDPRRPQVSGVDPQFTYSVMAWTNDTPRTIVGTGLEFNRTMVEGMEHVVDGFLNINGTFKGKIKAFGQWVQEEAIIPPPDDLEIPEGIDSLLGPLDIFIATMEFQQLNTTHPLAEYQKYQQLADRYAGFMVFRDGLRVLPYGREDNDFFEIEMRRSKSAGREFWNQRQMFGRIAISRAANPNLKDKAGREGLLDNRAAKTLKALISNILMQTARMHFGSASDARRDMLPEIRQANEKARAKEARNALRRKKRKDFQKNLKFFRAEMPPIILELRRLDDQLEVQTTHQIEEAMQRLSELKEKRAEFRLGEAPDNLGPLESSFAEFKNDMHRAQSLIAGIELKIQEAVEALSTENPRAMVERQLAHHASRLHKRIRAWKQSIEELQRREYDRTRSLVEQRNKIYHSESLPILDRVESGEVTLAGALNALEQRRQRLDDENEQIFGPYIAALESLSESIDLQSIATIGMEEVSELRTEIDRLNKLAQLGITVEIIGHELEDYDQLIGSAIRALPEEVRSLKPVQDIELGFAGLTDQLRFLSPLKLSGHRGQNWITGEDIWEYVRSFFGPSLVRGNIELSATQSFKRFRVFDQPARLFPVFINLVNNSRYWVTFQKDGPKQILLGTSNGKVLVSDSGPGVSEDDIPSLFTLFFTRKARGGRGVGLYLCRANLTAGGHAIEYMRQTEQAPLGGANFAISFQGAEFDE